MARCALLLLLVATVSVLSQDPTAVCYPQIFQAAFYNLITDDRGVISVNFAKQIFVEESAVNGVKYVHDFANLISYEIARNENATACKSYKLQQSKVMTRCLPPYAKRIAASSGYLNVPPSGYSAYALNAQTWEVETESSVIYRVSFSMYTGQPYYPSISQEYGYHGTTNVYLYFNATATITNQTIFNVPTNCIPYEVKSSPINGKISGI